MGILTFMNAIKKNLWANRQCCNYAAIKRNRLLFIIPIWFIVSKIDNQSTLQFSSTGFLKVFFPAVSIILSEKIFS